MWYAVLPVVFMTNSINHGDIQYIMGRQEDIVVIGVSALFLIAVASIAVLSSQGQGDWMPELSDDILSDDAPDVSMDTLTLAPATAEDLSGEELEKLADALRSRFEAAGVNVVVMPDAASQRIIVAAPGQNVSEAVSTLELGEFAAWIPVTVVDNETVTLGDRSYTVDRDGDRIRLLEQWHEPGDWFRISSGDHLLQFRYRERTPANATLAARVFTSADVQAVDITPEASGVQRAGGAWRYQFQIRITEDAADRMQDVAQTFDRGPTHGNLQDAELQLYLDDEQMSALGVANAFQDRLIREPLITGSASTQEEAVQEMDHLHSALAAGELPYPVEVVSRD